MSRDAKIGIGLCALLALITACCCALVIVGAGGLLFFQTSRSASGIVTAVAGVTPATARPPTATPGPSPTPTATPPPQAGAETLDLLKQAALPPRDLREVAARLKGIPDIPATVAAVPADHALDTVLTFYAHNSDTEANFTVRARLVERTDNVYFFAEEDLAVDRSGVRRLLDVFQNEIYPTNRAFFGSEWTPGVDGDPRLYILYVRGIGFSTLGYYSSVDEYSRLAHTDSNEKEIFYINADLTSPSSLDLASTLAHEFQHMIHWHQDPNETTWLNEGASMLAELLNGYDSPLGYAQSYTLDPDLQLNAWTDGDTIPHYGAAFLFLTYFLERFGEEATRALVAHPDNGLESLDAVLAGRGLADPATGRPLTAEEVFADWAVANYLNDAAVGDGRYVYRRLDGFRTTATTDEFTRCPVATRSETVVQYGVDYYRFECAGAYTLTFEGNRVVPVVPATPADGRYAQWSNRSDETVTTLTRAFDFTGLDTATLIYDAWWDIEENYDYAYLQVSTDAGRTWTILRAPSTTGANPTGANFGWGYTGRSDGWVEEVVDLSEYAGRPVLLRFEYITDAALNNPGFLVDDIRVPELGYQTDFEAGDDGWEAQGFVRMDNVLPQRFIVQLIRQGPNGTTVERAPLDAENRGQVTLTFGRGETVTLAVSGATRFTTEPARYEFSLEEK